MFASRKSTRLSRKAIEPMVLALEGAKALFHLSEIQPVILFPSEPDLHYNPVVMLTDERQFE